MPSPPPVLLALRAGTRVQHSAVEALPAMRRLMAPGVTVGDYTACLRGLFWFQATLRPALRHALQLAGDETPLSPRPLALLVADLAWFGVPAGLAGAPAAPVLDGLAAALGARYVIEGSALGGRVIGRHIADTLRLGAGAGASFFCGLTAEQARADWAALSGALAGLPDHAADAALGGARAAFAHFAACLTLDGPPGQTADGAPPTSCPLGRGVTAGAALAH